MERKGEKIDQQSKEKKQNELMDLERAEVANLLHLEEAFELLRAPH